MLRDCYGDLIDGEQFASTRISFFLNSTIRCLASFSKKRFLAINVALPPAIVPVTFVSTRVRTAEAFPASRVFC